MHFNITINVDVSEILGNTNEQKEIESNGIKQVTIANANDRKKELLEKENVRMIIKEGESDKDQETIKAIIPKGFYYVTGKPSTGLVISDKIGDDNNNSKGGNQFVWIPCNGKSGITYERTKDESTKFGLASQWAEKDKQFMQIVIVQHILKLKNVLYSLHHYVAKKNGSNEDWTTYRVNQKYYKGDINLGRRQLAKEDESKYKFYDF